MYIFNKELGEALTVNWIGHAAFKIKAFIHPQESSHRSNLIILVVYKLDLLHGALFFKKLLPHKC